MTEPKKLVRKTSDAWVAGVCSGLADYFGVDKTLIRVLWLLITVLTAVIGGTIAYLICWLVIPPEAPAAAAPPQRT